MKASEYTDAKCHLSSECLKDDTQNQFGRLKTDPFLTDKAFESKRNFLMDDVLLLFGP